MDGIFRSEPWGDGTITNRVAPKERHVHRALPTGVHLESRPSMPSSAQRIRFHARMDSAGSTERWARVLADAAVRALVEEAALSPKPGLADSRGGGAHDDLSFALMCRSAHVLHPFFVAMARAGSCEVSLQALRERLGLLGRSAEAAMLDATGGVNTHRGAIWALGLLLAAAGRGGDISAQVLAARAGAIARCEDPAAPTCTGNKGEAARRRYGVGGAKAQAQAGFPQVVRAALPQLRRSRRLGASEDAGRLDALLAIMAGLDDTCLLSRGGRQGLAGMQARAAGVLSAGGAGTAEGQRALRRLNDYALAWRLSPGGAADLLAAALFLDGLERGRDGALVHADSWASDPGNTEACRPGGAGNWRARAAERGCQSVGLLQEPSR
ncbi:triphosphoribosyl-dephospho-CoA synthase [Pusillimonas noertemannii]|uniref:Probable 2-(5''-triphosphoribosyl)-3'-dephosphocoenzyme-A synthase n=2 Tax=Pusillimonas noertemannii TaxID=305977 RepID=A0A2U1CPA2_9BURK|nr:triphosphoribosyl-dephospho-CoA synthase [Pusillimonas noertemannii]